MSHHKKFQYSASVNLALWVSIALFLLGIIEISGFVEFLPESLKYPLTGFLILLSGLLLFMYPLSEIKKEIIRNNQMGNEK